MCLTKQPVSDYYFQSAVVVFQSGLECYVVQWRILILNKVSKYKEFLWVPDQVSDFSKQSVSDHFSLLLGLCDVTETANQKIAGLKGKEIK